MKRKLLALAITGALAGYGANAAAADVAVSGFVDAFWTISDEASDTATGNQTEGLFNILEAEVDFAGGGVRVDLDTVSGGGDVNIEQANFSTGLGNGWSAFVGKFNSMLTDDVQDGPDMRFSTNTLLFNALSGAGAVNLTGIGVNGKAGPADITLAYVNDPSNSFLAANTDRENSFLVRIAAEAMPGLNLELGYLSQDHAGSIGNILDINGEYTINGFTVGLDYMMADPSSGSGDFDTGYSLMGGYDFGNGFGVQARIENQEHEGSAVKDIDTWAIYASYKVSSNFFVALQSENTDNGTTDNTKTTLEFIGTF